MTNPDDIRTRIAAGRFSEKDALILLLLADISEKLDAMLDTMNSGDENEVGN